MQTKVTTPVVKGVIISLVLIVFGIVVLFSGQNNNKGLSSLQFVIIVAGIIWGCINYSNQMNNNVTYSNVFVHGFKTTAVVIVIMSIYTILALKFFFPEMLDQGLEEARKKMEQNNMSDDDINSKLQIARKIAVPLGIAFIIVGFAIVGAISSLIGAAVAKKNPNGPFVQQEGNI